MDNLSSEKPKTYEMLWDCQYCNTKKNLGKTHRFCPNCGAAQNPSWRYFPADSEKVAVEDHQFVGADKVCPSCNALNSASCNNCGNCGSPLNAAQTARTYGSQVAGEGQGFVSDNLDARLREERDAQVGRVKPNEKDKGGVPIWVWIAGLLLLGLCGFGIYALTATQATQVVVTGHTWQRQIEILRYSAQNDSAWDEGVPSSAYNVSCRREQRDTRQIPDGQSCRTIRTDNGDGTFRESQQCETTYREEPVYDDRCSFTIDRWAQFRFANASGTSQRDTPEWPATSINACTVTRLGCEREGARVELYVLKFRDTQGNEQTCEVPLSVWQSVRLESTFNAQIGQFDSSLRCDSIDFRSGVGGSNNSSGAAGAETNTTRPTRTPEAQATATPAISNTPAPTRTPRATAAEESAGSAATAAANVFGNLFSDRTTTAEAGPTATP
jgi:ribosomal protein L40E